MPGGAPVGNKNASKSRVVEQALKRAAINEDWKRLHKGIEKVWDAAAEGDHWALEFIRDTLDGRPAQQVSLGGDEDNPIVQKIVVELVNAQNPDTKGV